MENLLTIEEAATRLKVNPETVRRQLALLDELDNFVSATGSPRAAGVLPPLTDEDIFAAVYAAD